MLKIFALLLIVAAVVGVLFHFTRKLIKHSAPVALAAAVVLTAFIAPVWAAHACAVLVVAGVFFVALV